MKLELGQVHKPAAALTMPAVASWEVEAAPSVVKAKRAVDLRCLLELDLSRRDCASLEYVFFFPLLH